MQHALPQQTRAWVWNGPGQPIELCLAPLLPPGPGEVLVQVKAVGVCGTDLGILDGKNPNARPPLALGHEIAGQVVALGAGTSLYQVGDRVFLDPYIGCGRCPACRAGNKTYCSGGGRHLGIHIPGGWQEYLALPELSCYPAPPNLGDAAVSQAETLYTVISGLKRLQGRPGSSALVIGDGPTGLLFSRVLPLVGCTTVTLAGHHPGRLELGRRWGAAQVIDTHQQPLEDALGERLFDMVVETVGSQAVVAQAVRFCAPAGQVVLFGIPHGGTPVALDTAAVVMRELSLLGATDAPSVWPVVANLLATGYVRVEDMISATYPFERLPEAVQAARSKQTVKIVICNGE